MNEKQAELTSAFLDGELDELAERRVVKELLQAATADRDRYARYRLIGDAMRGEAVVDTTTVPARVRAALADEPVVLAPSRSRASAWLKPVTGVALAASVAAVAIVVAPGMMTAPEETGSPVNIAQAPALQAIPVAVSSEPAVRPTEPDTARVASNGSKNRWQAIDPALQDRLNRLLIEHHEFSGRTGVNGPVSHVGMVSYDGR